MRGEAWPQLGVVIARRSIFSVPTLVTSKVEAAPSKSLRENGAAEPVEKSPLVISSFFSSADELDEVLPGRVEELGALELVGAVWLLPGVAEEEAIGAAELEAGVVPAHEASNARERHKQIEDFFIGKNTLFFSKN